MAKKTKRTRARVSEGGGRQKPWLWGVIGVALLLLLAGSVLLLRQPAAPASPAEATLPPEVDVAQAYRLYQQGAFVLDVRTPQEWDEFHAPNTTLIPLDELQNRVNEVPRDREVVVICRSGNRSQVGRDILRQAGFTRVTSVRGGLRAWRAAGYPVE